MGQMVQLKFVATEGVAAKVVDMCEDYTLADRIAWMDCTRCLAYLGKAHRTGFGADKGWYKGFPSSSVSMECSAFEGWPKGGKLGGSSKIEFDHTW